MTQTPDGTLKGFGSTLVALVSHEEKIAELKQLIREFAEYTKIVTPRSPRAKALRKQAELLLREDLTQTEAKPILLKTEQGA